MQPWKPTISTTVDTELQATAVENGHQAGQESSSYLLSNTPTSRGTFQATLQAASEALSPSAPLNMHYYFTKGLQDAGHRAYIDMHFFARMVKSQTKVAKTTSSVKYIVFPPISE